MLMYDSLVSTNQSWRAVGATDGGADNRLQDDDYVHVIARVLRGMR